MSLSTTSTHPWNTSRAYSEWGTSSPLHGWSLEILHHHRGFCGRGWRCGTTSPTRHIPVHKPTLPSSSLGAAAQKAWKCAHFVSFEWWSEGSIPSVPAAQAMQSELWMEGCYNHCLPALTEDSGLLGASLYPSSLFPSLGNQASLKLPSWCCWGLVVHLALWTTFFSLRRKALFHSPLFSSIA